MLAIDPLLDGGLLWTPLLIVAAQGARHLRRRPRRARCSWSGSSARSSPACRTGSGPNKAGPFGILQTLADGMKLIFKEDFLPDRADRFVYRLAPFLAFVPAFLVWSVIPLGGDFSDGNDGIVTWFGHETRGAARRPADRHPARAGAVVDRRLRHHARRLVERLEVPAARRRAGVGADDQLRGGARAQRRRRAAVGRHAVDGRHRRRARTRSPNWNLVATGIVPFVVFMIAATAELNRPPFDLVEAEQELVGGFNTEYSAFGFALFFLAEFMNTITMSAIIVTLFLGGPQPLAIGDWTADIPLIPNGLEGTLWFVAQDVRLPLRLRVAAGHAAPAALRPADGPRLEGADPGRARLVPAARRDPPRRRQRLERRCSSSSSRSPSWRCRRRCMLAAIRVSARNREREGALS